MKLLFLFASVFVFDFIVLRNVYSKLSSIGVCYLLYFYCYVEVIVISIGPFYIFIALLYVEIVRLLQHTELNSL